MKLNGISVGDYKVCKDLSLNEFGNGLNVVFGRNGTGKTTLVQFIRSVLYGFDSTDYDPTGWLEFSNNGSIQRLQRHQQSRDRLTVAERDAVTGGLRPDSMAPMPQALASISERIFDVTYTVDGRNAIANGQQLADILNTQFHIPQGDLQARIRNQRHRFDSSLSDLQSRLRNLVDQISHLDSESLAIQRQADTQNSGLRDKRAGLERDIRDYDARIQSADRQAIQNQIQLLDDQIAGLRSRVEQVQMRTVEVGNVAASPDTLSLLYRRLDEIDNQIQRWRNVHLDIQQQRVKLKDEMLLWNEMTLESTQHPYHRSREILRQLETSVGQAESAASEIANHRVSDQATAGPRAEQMLGFCRQIREGLYSLCDELGQQYKTIRHHSATGELKRLRRCYHEIGENIESLVSHRQQIVEEIRQLDPQGADAIGRADNEFCQCAHHEGYMAARRRFVGELSVHQPPAVRSDATAGSLKLRELEEMRAARVRELVAIENQVSEWKVRRSAMTQELSQFGTVNLADYQTRLQTLARERQTLTDQKRRLELELQDVQAAPNEQEHPIVSHANQLISRLTQGEITRIWLATNNSHANMIEVEDRHASPMMLGRLSSGLQQQVVLGLSMAIVDHYYRLGNSMPMLLDDVFVNLDPNLIRATYEVLEDFCRRGNQVVAFTADQTVVQLARQTHGIVFDLPQTTVSPVVPMWSPDRSPLPPPREPDFLTPFTTRRHEKLTQDAMQYPQVKYPAAGHLIDHSISNFEVADERPVATAPAPAPPVSRPRVSSAAPARIPFATPSKPVVSTPIQERSELDTLAIIDPNLLDTLNRNGIYSVMQLLELNPSALPAQLQNERIAASDVDRWQSLIWLRMCVPSLSSTDAELLVAVGINEPEQLETTGSQQLLDRISRYVNSADSRSISRLSQNYSRDTVDRWYDSLNQTRNRWRLPSGYSRRGFWQDGSNQSDRSNIQSERSSRRNERVTTSTPARTSSSRSQQRSDYPAIRQRSERSDRAALADRERSRTTRSSQSSRSQRTRRDATNSASSLTARADRSYEPRQSDHRNSLTAQKSNTRKRPKPTKLKFYLDLADRLEAAPSIGPKTEERFIAIGVRTVGEFLAQTAESMAPKLNYKRITADVIRQWQHQARLVCRVPNLRGHDSQLLVACGIVEPEDLADRRAEQLFSIIQPFSESKEGLKIIRGGKLPDLAEITDWINWAQQTRSLQAA